MVLSRDSWPSIDFLKHEIQTHQLFSQNLVFGLGVATNETHVHIVSKLYRTHVVKDNLKSKLKMQFIQWYLELNTYFFCCRCKSKLMVLGWFYSKFHLEIIKYHRAVKMYVDGERSTANIFLNLVFKQYSISFFLFFFSKRAKFQWITVFRGGTPRWRGSVRCVERC